MQDYSYNGVRPALRATEKAPDIAALESVSEEQLRLPGAYAVKMSIDPDAAGVDAYLETTALGAEAATVDEFDGQPDFPRQLLITANADSVTGDIVIAGVDFFGNEITETISLADDGETEYASTLMYRELTSVDLPVASEPGASIQIGSTNVLNFPFIAAENTIILITHDGTQDSTYTLSADADYTKCTLTPTAALDGELINIYFLQ